MIAVSKKTQKMKIRRDKNEYCFPDSPKRTSTLVYNKVQDKWDSTNTPTLPLKFTGFGISPINRKRTKILLTGGLSDEGIGNAAYVYHWITKLWADVGPLKDGNRRYQTSIFFKADKETNDKVMSFLKCNYWEK